MFYLVTAMMAMAGAFSLPSMALLWGVYYFTTGTTGEDDE